MSKLWEVFNGQITYDEIQNFADEFTGRLMHAKYGKRFDECEELETDDDMNRDWEYLNDGIYGLIDEWTD